MNRQLFSMVVGLIIAAAHIGLTLYFLFVFDAPGTVFVQEISMPITAAYVSAIVMWFFANNGQISSNEQIGIPLVILVLMIVFAMIGSLFYVPWSFMEDELMTVEAVNRLFLGVETAFGGLFGIVMTELFGYRRDQTARDPSQDQ